MSALRFGHGFAKAVVVGGSGALAVLGSHAFLTVVLPAVAVIGAGVLVVNALSDDKDKDEDVKNKNDKDESDS